jgi:glyoxylase-like metal-dependent hydrolase (beta-lactamase superfamily II)
VPRTRAVPVADDVWRIPTAPADLVNSYAIRATDGSVTLVDAGMRRGGAGKRILTALADIGARPADVARIVLTHAHFDHAGGLQRLIDHTGAPVLSHERDSVYLRDGRSPRTERATGAARLIGWFPPRRLPKVVVAEEFRHDSVLAGGLRIIHTPGHTPGHVSLLHEPSGVLITGDAVFNVRGLRFPPPFLCTDSTVNRRSADLLGDLDYEVAAFTHGPEIRDKAREAVRAFLRNRER